MVSGISLAVGLEYLRDPTIPEKWIQRFRLASLVETFAFYFTQAVGLGVLHDPTGPEKWIQRL